MKRAVLISIIDQGLNSAFNLMLSLAFIAFATPSEFGRFAFILAGSFFAMSAQNALILMPLNYLLPGRPAAEAEAALSRLTSANVALAFAGLPFALGLAALVGADIVLSLAAVVYFLMLAMREYLRSILVVRAEMHRVLQYDAVAVVASTLVIAGLWRLLPPEAAVFAGLALGNLLPVLIVRVDVRARPALFVHHLGTYRHIWQDTRWALQGALQNEVVVRSYVFLVERFRDTATLGTLNAGRTVLSPLMLVGGAWCRVARPRLVADFAAGRRSAAFRLVLTGCVAVAAMAVLYALVLVVAWPWLEAHGFRGRYANMPEIVSAWWLYALISGQVSVVSTILEARRQFRALAMVGACNAVATPLALIVLLAAGGPAEAAVLVLAATALAEGIANAILAFRPPSASVLPTEGAA